MSAPRRRLVEALLRALLRIHPRPFRVRFGADVEREATDALRGGRRTATFLVADLLGTWLRSWTGVLAGVVAGAVRALAPASAGRDLRFALRALRRHPLHAAVVIATLAVAIGANTAVFTLTHHLLLRTLPYGAPERIVRVENAAGFSQSGPVVRPFLKDHPGVEAAAVYCSGDATSR